MTNVAVTEDSGEVRDLLRRAAGGDQEALRSLFARDEGLDRGEW
jgi:hypothetical protein